MSPTRRRGFSAEDVLVVRRAYKTLYREGRTLEDAKVVLAAAAESAPLLRPLVDFLAERFGKSPAWDRGIATGVAVKSR